MNKHLLSRLTWVEAREAAAQKRVIILPVGTTENQSLHNLLGYDHIVAERLGEAVALRTGSLLAPTIPYGCSQMFRDYPGTVVWRFDTLAAALRDTIGKFSAARLHPHPAPQQPLPQRAGGRGGGPGVASHGRDTHRLHHPA